MKCCHCSHNAFTTIDGAALCLNCHTAFQNVSNNQVSSALQSRRGSDIADSMLKARASLKNTEIKNHNTHNNITVHGNNSGILNTGKAQIKNNDIGITNSTKSGINISWLAKVIMGGLKLISLCLQPLKRLFW